MHMIPESDTAWGYSMSPRGNITFGHTVPEYISRVILDGVRKNISNIDITYDSVLFSLREVSDPAGRYCLQSGGARWFVRVTRKPRKNPILEDAVREYVRDAGIHVILPAGPGFNLYWNGQAYLIYVFPFVNGRHFNNSDDDIVSLSSVLRYLHNVLKAYKLGPEIRSAALETAHRLFYSKEKIATLLKADNFSTFYELSKWAEQNRDWLKEAVGNFNPYMCLIDGSQCVHGELHTGNVIFSLENSDVIITDFEETPDAWFPVSFDLAYLVHRFCLFDEPSNALFLKRLKMIKDSYGFLPPDLKEMMLQVCRYLIVLIFDRCMRRESIVPEEECDKFLKLEKLTHTVPLPVD